MLRIAILVVMLGGVARADSKADIEALLKKNIDAAQADNWKAFDATFRSDGYYFLPNQFEKLVDRFHTVHAYNVRHKIERMTIVADDKAKVAWFHVEFTGKYQVALYDTKEQWFDDRFRIIGIAIDDGGWKLAAAFYSKAFADKLLYKNNPPQDKPDKITFKGERTTAEYAQRWFTKGLLPDMASGTVAVNGTAPGEWAVGTTVPKLVTAWDKLKLWPIKISGRRWKSYPIGLVIAEVGLPYKKGAGGVAEDDGVAKLRVAAIVIPDGAAWKWTALCFADGFDDFDGDVHGPNWTPPKSP